MRSASKSARQSSQSHDVRDMYRLALTGALDLSFPRKWPKGATEEQIGKFVAARMDFNEYQMIAERALLRARK
jgi:hypothetical protein